MGDSSSLNRSLKEATVASNRFGKEVSHSLRGVASGTGIMHGFGRSLAFASGGFLAFEGVSRFLEESVSAARDAGVAQRSLTAQMKTSGESFAASKDQIEQANLRLAKFGFTSEDAVHALTVLERGTGSIGEALKLETLSADLARAKNIDLASAANVVAKVFGGQETALRRAVPGLAKNAHGIELIRLAQQRLAGQAAAGTTASEQFAAALHDTEVTVGTALLPTLDKFLTSMSEWLSKSENQKRIQRDVEQAVNAATGAFKAAKGALDALNTITGSTKDTVKLLFSAFVAFKTLKFASTFAQIAGSIRGVGADAEKSTGKVKGLGGALRGVPELVAITLGIDVVMSAHTTAHGAHRYSGSAGWGNLWHDLGHPMRLIQNLSGGGGGGGGGGPGLLSPGFKFDFGHHDELRALLPEPHDLPTVQAALPIVGRGGLTPMQRNALALSAAGRTKTTKDNLAALVTQRQLLGKAIATETARLNQATSAGQAKKFADNLQSLYDKDTAAMDQIAGIVKKGAQQQGKTGAELAAQRNTFFDNAITRALDRVTDITSAGGRIAALQKVNALITKRIAATKDITRKLNLEDQVTANLRTIKGERATQQQDVIDALGLKLSRADLTKSVSDNIAVLQETNAKLAEQNRLYGVTKDREQQITANQVQIQGLRQQQKDTRKQARDTARQNLLDQLQFNVDKTELTKGQEDNLKALQAEKAGVLKMIAAEGLTLANKKELLRVQLEINAKNQEIADARKAGRDAAKQATADAKQSQLDAANLAVAKAGLTDTLVDDLAANEKLLAVMKKTGASAIDIVNQQKTINDLWKQLADAAGTTRKLFKRLNATAFVNQFGEGLSRQQKRRLEIGLGAMGPGGTLPAGQSHQFTAGITIHGGVHMHGVQDVPGFENQLAKRAKARPHVRRGARG